MEDALKLVSKVLLIAGMLLCTADRVLDTEWLMWLAVGLLVLGFGADCLWRYVRRKNNASNPITTVRAKVLYRRFKRYGRHKAQRRYFITFRPENGVCLEFGVPYAEYEARTEGETGVLRYRTWEYLSFTRGEVLTETPPAAIEVSSSIVMQEIETAGPQPTSGILTHEIDK